MNVQGKAELGKFEKVLIAKSQEYVIWQLIGENQVLGVTLGLDSSLFLLEESPESGYI